MEMNEAEVRERLKQIRNEIERDVYKMLRPYSNREFKIHTYLKRSERKKVTEDKKSYIAITTDIIFVNQNLDEIFGSSFNLYWENGKVTMNHGCMGEFDRKENGLADRCIMMGNIWLSHDYVENTLRILDLKYKDEFINLYNIKEEHDIQREKDEREVRFVEWLEGYKAKIGNMTIESLTKERRRLKASQKKYNNISQRVIDAVELEWSWRK